jgi:hypothetical protein
MGKKLITALLLPLMLSALVACAGETAAPTSPATKPNPTPAPRPAPAPGPTLGIMFDTVPDVISPYGKTADINLSFTNEASEPRTVSRVSSFELSLWGTASSYYNRVNQLLIP